MTREEKIRKVLAIRKEIVAMAGYTAGVEHGEDGEIPDELWDRAAKHYARLLKAEGLEDDLTEEEVEKYDV